MIHRMTQKDGGNEREIRRIALEKLVDVNQNILILYVMEEQTVMIKSS